MFLCLFQMRPEILWIEILSVFLQVEILDPNAPVLEPIWLHAGLLDLLRGRHARVLRRYLRASPSARFGSLAAPMDKFGGQMSLGTM